MLVESSVGPVLRVCLAIPARASRMTLSQSKEPDAKSQFESSNAESTRSPGKRFRSEGGVDLRVSFFCSTWSALVMKGGDVLTKRVEAEVVVEVVVSQESVVCLC